MTDRLKLARPMIRRRARLDANQTRQKLLKKNVKTERLFERHPDAGGFVLNLGTESGTDIVSVAPGVVAAETFAAVHPMNNRKLPKDLRKLADTCPHVKARYVFFAAPNYKHERQRELERIPGIEVWGIDV
jgi:hypothetical protein